MLIRPYADADAAATLDVFLRAVSTTARQDYTAGQIAAWAGGDRELTAWNRARHAANTRVAVVGGRVAGFTDVTEGGYIDMLYVDPCHGRTGIASALLEWAAATARAAGAQQLSTFASITAAPFFAARGFAVEEERTPVVRGVPLTNYRMSRPLS